MKIEHLNFYIFILVLFVMTNLSAQTDAKTYDEVSQLEFEKINNDSRINKKSWSLVPKNKNDHDKKKSEPKKENSEIPWATKSLKTGSSGITDVLAYLAIIVLIALLVYFILSKVKVNPKVVEEVDLDKLENIEEVDVVKGYETAKQSQNYRLAIRMQFIKLLQYLNENQLIKWRNEKTNRDYKREIEDPSTRQHFSNLSTIFERSWYGNKEIDERGFLEVDAIYKSFFTKVGR